MLSETLREFVAHQRLGFLATVCIDGSPNLSPKGITFVYDQNRIVIGEVRSPGSIKNLRANPIAELNVVDRNTRKGFRFKGVCKIHTSGEEYDQFLAFLRTQGVQSEIRSIIIMVVEVAKPLISPIYDNGAFETDVRDQWERYYEDGGTGFPSK